MRRQAGRKCTAQCRGAGAISSPFDQFLVCDSLQISLQLLTGRWLHSVGACSACMVQQLLADPVWHPGLQCIAVRRMLLQVGVEVDGHTNACLPTTSGCSPLQ